MDLRTGPRLFEATPPSRDYFSREAISSSLLSQSQNAVPFLFEKDFGGIRLDATRPFIQELVDASKKTTEQEWEVGGFFRFALSVHWATCASFAPADVESLIRFKLWSTVLTSEEKREMAECVLEAYHWDSTALSRRWVSAPYSRLVLSSHHGEWFAVATAAYYATRTADPMLSMRIREQIEFEVTREAKIYLEFRKNRDGVGLMLSAGLMTQNLSELDRAIDLWGLPNGDPLREFAYRASQAEGTRAARFGGALAEAGRMNRSIMAPENQRSFSLRSARGLRRSAELFLPLAPFLEEWGRRVATHPALTNSDRAGVVEALYLGWEKMKGSDGKTITLAYPRAVSGLVEAFPGGMSALAAILPLSIERQLRSGLFSSLVSVPEARFREKCAAQVLGMIRTSV